MSNEDSRETGSCAFSGERIVENKTPMRIWQDHIERYQFATGFSTGKEVLDVACGNGYGSIVLKKGGASNVIGMDISKETISYAENNLLDNGVRYLVGDIQSICLESESLDMVVCFETIEHVVEQREALEQVYRVLKTGGLLIISSPNRTLTSPFKCLNDKPLNPYHMIEYTTNEFVSFVSSRFLVMSVYGQRGIRNILVNRSISRLLRRVVPSLYNADRGNSNLETINPRKEYRYVTILALKE